MRHLGLFLPLLVACGGGDSASTAPGSLTLSTESLDFGAVELGTTTVLSLELTNPGSGDIDLLSVSLIEGQASQWSVDRNDIEVVAGGTTAEVLVSFTPDDSSAEVGRIQVRSSDADNPSQFVSLSGSGALSTVDGDGDGFSPADGDCDDENASVNPGASEICDLLDTDCDGIVPLDENDNDFDGIPVCGGDCDDDNGEIYPGAVEVCDGVDNDCVAGGDEDDDNDGDGETPCDGDCDDTDAEVFLGAAEVCDGIDNDCDGGIDDVDADGDGHTVCSATGDCDDNDANAFPVVVSGYGTAYGLGTDADPFDSLATALANLDQVCHEIHFEPGTYEVDAQIDGNFVAIYGGSAANTEFTAAPYSRLLTVSNNADVVIEDVTFSGGDAATDGGAIKVETGATLTLNGVVIDGNASATDGGAIAVSSATLLLRNGCDFLNNAAADDGGALSLVSPVLFSDRGATVYVGNTAGNGGAISVFGGSVDARDQWFGTNEATLGDGGALQLSGGGSYLVQRAHFEFNTAAAAGGAVALTDIDDSGGWVRNLEVASNTAGSVGGGIAVTGATAAIGLVNNTLVGNTASGEGGGLHVGVTNASNLVVQANLIGWSNADSGAYVAPGSTATVDFNTSYATSTLVEFAGAVAVDVDDNYARDPLFVTFTDDGVPGNDDLDLRVGSFERDAGPPAPAMNDNNGSQNDRGSTGGPGA